MKIFKNLLDFMSFFNTEEKCHQFLKSLLWKQGKSCPCCGCSKIIEFKDFKKIRCKDCKFEFSIRKGTIFESSRISLQKWFMCIYLMNSNKKGISTYHYQGKLALLKKQRGLFYKGFVKFQILDLVIYLLTKLTLEARLLTNTQKKE